jgi:steroid delta-isomerase-like uncharacterized protein
MEDANKALARGFYAELWNKGNFDAASQYLHPDHFDHNPPLPRQGQGAQGVIDMISTFRAGFPDLVMTVDEIVAEGDRVVERLTLTGTHTGPFLGLPPTGRAISVKSINVCRIEDGLVRERWGVGDDVAMMEQLGLLPVRGSAAWRASLTIAGAATRLRSSRRGQAAVMAGLVVAGALVIGGLTRDR